LTGGFIAAGQVRVAPLGANTLVELSTCGTATQSRRSRC
jgi:hypothetical protein